MNNKGGMEARIRTVVLSPRKIEDVFLRYRKWRADVFQSVLVFLMSCILLAGCQRSANANWDRLIKDIRLTFPTVKQVSTDELQNWMTAQDEARPLLIDRRERAEYEVSHLQGALPANDAEEALKIIEREGKNRPVVVYCSVGYRSSVLARKLGKMGITNIYNLEGSIFKWANEGRPVYHNDRQVRVVHPFDSKWRNFLDKELWYTPGNEQ
ncbi:MAG: rhodanese-like domain-containing protein [Nitrospirota bacterium]